MNQNNKTKIPPPAKLKPKRTNWLRYFSLILILSLVFYSCQKDEFEEVVKAKNLFETKLKFEDKTFSELNKEAQFKRAYQKILILSYQILIF